MSLAATLWLVGRGTPRQPDGLYLHVYEDGDTAWSADLNRALRFVSEADADRYGSARVEPTHAVEVSTALLAVPAEDEADLEHAAG